MTECKAKNILEKMLENCEHAQYYDDPKRGEKAEALKLAINILKQRNPEKPITTLRVWRVFVSENGRISVSSMNDDEIIQDYKKHARDLFRYFEMDLDTDLAYVFGMSKKTVECCGGIRAYNKKQTEEIAKSLRNRLIRKVFNVYDSDINQLLKMRETKTLSF